MAVGKHELSSLSRLPGDSISPSSLRVPLPAAQSQLPPWKLQPLWIIDTSVTTDSQQTFLKQQPILVVFTYWPPISPQSDWTFIPTMQLTPHSPGPPTPPYTATAPSTYTPFRIAFARHCWLSSHSRNHINYRFWWCHSPMLFLSPWVIFSKLLCPCFRVSGHQSPKEKIHFSFFCWHLISSDGFSYYVTTYL